MSGNGGNALEACLPADLYELYLEASRNTPRRRRSVVITSGCDEISTAPHVGPPNDGERPIRRSTGARCVRSPPAASTT